MNTRRIGIPLFSVRTHSSTTLTRSPCLMTPPITFPPSASVPPPVNMRRPSRPSATPRTRRTPPCAACRPPPPHPVHLDPVCCEQLQHLPLPAVRDVESRVPHAVVAFGVVAVPVQGRCDRLARRLLSARRAGPEQQQARRPDRVAECLAVLLGALLECPDKVGGKPERGHFILRHRYPPRRSRCTSSRTPRSQGTPRGCRRTGSTPSVFLPPGRELVHGLCRLGAHGGHKIG